MSYHSKYPKRHSRVAEQVRTLRRQLVRGIGSVNDCVRDMVRLTAEHAMSGHTIAETRVRIPRSMQMSIEHQDPTNGRGE